LTRLDDGGEKKSEAACSHLVPCFFRILSSAALSVEPAGVKETPSPLLRAGGAKRGGRERERKRRPAVPSTFEGSMRLAAITVDDDANAPDSSAAVLSGRVGNPLGERRHATPFTGVSSVGPQQPRYERQLRDSPQKDIP
jgi:hypothetical protein